MNKIEKKINDLKKQAQNDEKFLEKCVIAKNNDDCYNKYYCHYREEGKMNLQYAMISIPKTTKGDIEINVYDIVEAFISATKVNVKVVGNYKGDKGKYP